MIFYGVGVNAAPIVMAAHPAMHVPRAELQEAITAGIPAPNVVAPNT